MSLNRDQCRVITTEIVVYYEIITTIGKGFIGMEIIINTVSIVFLSSKTYEKKNYSLEGAENHDSKLNNII